MQTLTHKTLIFTGCISDNPDADDPAPPGISGIIDWEYSLTASRRIPRPSVCGDDHDEKSYVELVLQCPRTYGWWERITGLENAGDGIRSRRSRQNWKRVSGKGGLCI